MVRRALLLVMLMLPLLAHAAFAIPPMPHEFHGIVVIDRQYAPVGTLVEVWDTEGRRLLTDGTFDPQLNTNPVAHPQGIAHSHETAQGPVRTMWEPVDIGGKRIIIRAAVSELPARAQIRSLWTELGVISLVVLTVGGVIGRELAKRLVGPLSRMARDAQRITA